MKTAVFIGGMPRSGTTLLRDLFDDQANCDVLHTDHCLYSDFSSLNRYKTFPSGQGPNTVRKWHDYMSQHSPVGKWGISSADLQFTSSQIDYYMYCDAMYRCYLSQRQTDFFVFKAPGLEHYFETISKRDLFSEFELYFIYIVRNPIDQTLSMKFALYTWSTIKYTTKNSLANALRWRDSYLDYLFFKEYHPGNTTMIRYEDLINQKTGLNQLNQLFDRDFKFHMSDEKGERSSIAAYKKKAALTSKETEGIRLITDKYVKHIYASSLRNIEIKDKTLQIEIKDKTLQSAYIESISPSLFGKTVVAFAGKFVRVILGKAEFYIRIMKMRKRND